MAASTMLAREWSRFEAGSATAAPATNAPPHAQRRNVNGAVEVIHLTRARPREGDADLSRSSPRACGGTACAAAACSGCITEKRQQPYSHAAKALVGRKLAQRAGP